MHMNMGFFDYNGTRRNVNLYVGDRYVYNGNAYAEHWNPSLVCEAVKNNRR